MRWSYPDELLTLEGVSLAILDALSYQALPARERFCDALARGEAHDLGMSAGLCDPPDDTLDDLARDFAELTRGLFADEIDEICIAIMDRRHADLLALMPVPDDTKGALMPPDW